MNNSDSPDRIEYIRTEGELKDWNNEEVQQLNNSIKICCIPLPRKFYLFFKYVAPTLILLASFVGDIYSDLAVAVRHYIDGHYWWGGLTIIFIYAPAILYLVHGITELLSNPNIQIKKKLLWIILYIFTSAGFFMWPLWSYLKRLYYVIQAVFDKNKSVEHLEKFHSTGEGKDGMQKIFKAFLQSAPQLMLQFYIMLHFPPSMQDVNTVVAQIVSAFFSLNAMTVVIVYFEVNSKHHPSRGPQRNENGEDMSCIIIEYLWWFCSITSRMLALVFFASVFKFWVFLICAIHAATMSTCLLFGPPNFTWKKIIVSIFMGFVYIFCFIEYKVDFGMLGRVTGLYVLYYGFTFVQNICMIMSAYFLADSYYAYQLPIVVMHFVLFFLAIIFMLIYLGFLRPLYLKLIQQEVRPPNA